MAIIHSYFDDSADSKRQRFMAVGGLIGADEQFTELDIRWSDATNKLKEPFRSTDCETQHGQFLEWPKADCDVLMERLVKVILKTELMIYGSVVPVPEYRAVFPEANEYDPYFLALSQTLINMSFIGSQSGFHDVRVCCEDSTATSGRAKQVYDNLKAFKGWPWRDALVGFKSGSKKLMALQAADMMAREAYKHADNLGSRKTRKPVKYLHKRMHFHLWTMGTLEHLRDNGGPQNFHYLTRWGASFKVPQFRVFHKSSFDLT